MTTPTGRKVETMTPQEFMAEHNIDDEEEFDRFYCAMLEHVREYGTHGTEAMLKFVAAQLETGDEVL
jgi:hypothetical protein